MSHRVWGWESVWGDGWTPGLGFIILLATLRSYVKVLSLTASFSIALISGMACLIAYLKHSASRPLGPESSTLKLCNSLH